MDQRRRLRSYETRSPSDLHPLLSAHRPDLLLEPHELLLLEADQLFPTLEERRLLVGEVARFVLKRDLQRILVVEGNLRLAFDSLGASYAQFLPLKHRSIEEAKERTRRKSMHASAT